MVDCVNKTVYIILLFLLFIIISLFTPSTVFGAELSGTYSSGTNTYTIGKSGTYTAVSEDGFKITGGNLTLESVSPFFYFKGPITITGGTLTIKFSDSYSGTGSVLKREVEGTLRNSEGYIPYNASSGTTVQFSGNIFVVKGGTLNIEGTSTREMSFSGAGQFNIDKENGICTFPATSDTTDDVEVNGSLINISDTGTVNLKYVTLNSNYNNVNAGGAIVLSGTSPKLTMDYCTIKKCYSVSSGGAIYISTTEGGSVVINNSYINDNFTAALNSTTGGTIRCTGVNMCTLELNNTTIGNNYSFRAGGAIAWNAMRIDPLLINNCKIDGNVCSEGPGGIGVQSLMTIIGATSITNNKSLAGTGGGVGISTWGSQNPATNFELNQDGNIVLGSDVVISDNFAQGDGGGINFKVTTIKTNTTASNPDDIIEYTTKSDGTPYSMSLIINGATIKNNISNGNGAGIAMYKQEDSPYIMQVQMNEGEISQNITNLNGGAAYLFGDGADFIMNGGTIKGHTQSADGGAVYTDGGSFKMLGGTIENNESLNDGTIYVKSGSFEMLDGVIQDNNAINGGGVYVSGGNVNITGGIIQNCQATNGGAIYISNGNLLMDGGKISNNQSSNNGGGIYASSDTQDLSVIISSGSIIGNISGKNGGGLAVSMGSSLKAIVTIGLETCQGIDENHSHPVIQDNTANEYGGGFWLNGDSMTMNMYCGAITENLAILEPGSANIYQTGGIATVYAGDVGEGVIVIGGEYIYVPENQTEEIMITYDSNNPDNSEQKTALVTIGVEIYLPKTLFTRDGYVLVGWAHVAEPTDDDVIYSVGEPYLIGETDVTVYAVWLLEGSGTIETPVIKAGKYYEEITGGTNIIISSNASFTTQMSVLQIQPNYYTNRTLSFDKNLPIGTNITMVDLSNTSERKYYYYKVANVSTKSIALSEFIENGENEKYVDSTFSELVDEKYLFIVELPKENQSTGAMQVILTRNSADSKIAAINQTATFTSTVPRSSELNYETDAGSLDEATVESTIKISYINENAIGTDTRYENKKVALIIRSIDGILSQDTKISDGTNEYLQNGNNHFIIPLGDIDKNEEINLSLISKSLSENELSLNLKCELWASESSNNPCMGEKIAETESIELASIELPAVKISMDKKAYTTDEFSGNLEIDYEVIDFEDYSVTLEIQKKVSSNSYVTQTNLLTIVNGNSENTDGVFDIELNSNGSIDLEFVEGFNEQIGTYRILLKVSDESGNEFKVPCNFMIEE